MVPNMISFSNPDTYRGKANLLESFGLHSVGQQKYFAHLDD